MPLPTPSDGESHDEFIERCMSDETMQEDFPDEGQRLAVCERQWEESQEGQGREAVYRALRARPWALEPSALAELASAVLAGRPSSLASAAGQPDRAGSVQVLPVRGLLRQRFSGLFDFFFGGTSAEGLGRAFRQAVADDTVSAIVLDVDSPGGEVYGMDELSAEIYQARRTKPVVAVANSLMASAAYWVASAADEVVVTPGGEVGSIGVWAMHEDLSRALDSMGVTITLLSAGKYKVEGNPFEPLSDEARAALQQGVDDYYDLFVRAVARNRGVKVSDVKTGYGEGRVLTAKRALAAGLVDRIDTLPATIARLAGGRGRGGSRAEAAGTPHAPALAVRRRRLRLQQYQ